jgi:hypothetical protein
VPHVGLQDHDDAHAVGSTVSVHQAPADVIAESKGLDSQFCP